jgi:hypothetical protein
MAIDPTTAQLPLQRHPGVFMRCRECGREHRDVFAETEEEALAGQGVCRDCVQAVLPQPEPPPPVEAEAETPSDEGASITPDEPKGEGEGEAGESTGDQPVQPLDETAEEPVQGDANKEAE